MNQHSIDLQHIILKAKESLLRIDPSELEAKLSPEKWSKKEILGHLIDSAYNNHQRFLRAEKQGNLIFEGYDQVDWVAKNRYQKIDHLEIIEMWYSANNHLAQLIAGIPEQVLNQKTSHHNFDKICFNTIKSSTPTSLSYLILDYIVHLEHHLNQIIKVKGKR